LQAFDITLGFFEREINGQTKRHRRERQCLSIPSATVHARPAAVAYEEHGARVHGLDAAHLQHVLSVKLLELQELQVNLQMASECSLNEFPLIEEAATEEQPSRNAADELARW
jgi:hypothetical protein